MISDRSLGPRLFSGRAFTLVRAAWLVFAVLAAGLCVAAIPARLQQLLTVSPDASTAVGQLRPADAAAMGRVGLSVGGYATYFTTLEVGALLVFFVVATVIFMARSHDGLALLASTALILLALLLPVVTALEARGVAWRGLILFLQAAALGTIVPFLLLFPDGRFVPRWLAVAWVAYAVGWLVFPPIRTPIAFGSLTRAADLLLVAWAASCFGVAVLAQVYRYDQVATAIQRQQTKWVVFGLAVFITVISVGLLLLASSPLDPRASFSVFARLAGPTLILAGALAIPISIGVSILRYRLWDIDIIVRRTLVYSVLTGLLALAYFASVVLLQGVVRAFTGQEQDQLITVASTLAIAALFVPLRGSVQHLIDRRFYRRHYDAAKTLAAFSASLRDEVELDALRERLLRVVDETMQPEAIVLWLRPGAGHGPASKSREH